jgi:glycosyltransferase involved in cell wall biosynthesis
LYRLFKSHRFDVVHTHTPKAGLLGPLAARLAGVPVVVHTIHGLLFHDQMPSWRRRIFWLPEKWTASLSHALLSQSREDIETAISSGLCGRSKVKYIGNGIDVKIFSRDQIRDDRAVTRAQLGFDDTDFVVGTVGRLVYEKGFAELFQAAERLRAQSDKIKFLVIGAEEHDQNDAVPHETIEKLQSRKLIEFVGWSNDMPRWYAAMDAFVLPSYREGIPRACMEAAAMQLPVVASDIRGCREVVEQGITGLLVPVRSADALVDAILQLFRDRSLAEQMGFQGQCRIRAQFDSKLVASRLHEFYSSIDQMIATGASAA